MSKDLAPGLARALAEPLTGNILGLPAADSAATDGADIVLTGVPSDAGADGRLGAEHGPQGLRDVSWTFGGHSHALGRDIFDELSVVDGGDLPCTQDDLAGLRIQVQERAYRLARGGQIPGFFGGNQSLTLGALRGIQQAKRRPVSLLHLTPSLGFRAHAQGETCTIAQAHAEGLIKKGGALQIGVRGPCYDGQESQEAFRAGFERLSIDEVRWDIHGSMETVRGFSTSLSLYVSVDLSSLDPSVCPGVTRPTPGGLSAWEMQQVLRSLVGADIVGFDVVGLSPAFDSAELAAVVGVGVLHELLVVIAESRDSARISIVGGSAGRTSA